MSEVEQATQIAEVTFAEKVYELCSPYTIEEMLALPVAKSPEQVALEQSRRAPEFEHWKGLFNVSMRDAFQNYTRPLFDLARPGEMDRTVFGLWTEEAVGPSSPGQPGSVYEVEWWLEGNEGTGFVCEPRTNYEWSWCVDWEATPDPMADLDSVARRDPVGFEEIFAWDQFIRRWALISTCMPSRVLNLGEVSDIG